MAIGIGDGDASGALAILGGLLLAAGAVVAARAVRATDRPPH